MDPESPSATEPVVRPHPPRERHNPAHLADYDVQLPPNLHPEKLPADSLCRDHPDHQDMRLDPFLLVWFPVIHPDLIPSAQQRSPRYGLSDLQAAMLEVRPKTLDLEELQQQNLSLGKREVKSVKQALKVELKDQTVT